MKSFQPYHSILIALLSFIPFMAIAQEQRNYTVYKLENKIGTENFEMVKAGDSLNYKININTNDRGMNMSLTSSLKSFRQKYVAYRSIGNTSRSAKENIDTSFISNTSYPIRNNGSIKLKELLVNDWIRNGKPGYVLSAISGDTIKINLLDTVKFSEIDQKLMVIELRNLNSKNEILWMNDEGKAIFLATCDTESDKREVIDNNFVHLLDAFTSKSNEYLIQTYKNNNKSLGKSFTTLAIIDANVLDLNTGNWIAKQMLILKEGKIIYLGKINKEIIPVVAQQIDATGKYIIPGLWDMHAHLFHPDDLKNALLAGVTTVRDMANEFNFINSLKTLNSSSTFPSPTILRAGVIEGKTAISLGAIQVSNGEEISAAVKKYHDAGFDQIKIYSKISRKNLPLIFEQAKRYNMDLVGHIPDALTLKYAVENGMKMISHVHYFMNAMKWNQPDLQKANESLLKLLKEKNVVVDPTLNVYLTEPQYKMDNYKAVTRFLFSNGIPIIAGTDTGKIADELALYVSAGLSPLEAIKAATVVPAQVMKMDRQSGSIEVGKNADLLILNGNPIVDIRNINKIDKVIKGNFVISL
jgi:imidazolonepropionase-like amidohydrolase